MDRRVEILIEGRVTASVDEASVERAKARAAEVEAMAQEAGEALESIPEGALRAVQEAAEAFGRLSAEVRRLAAELAQLDGVAPRVAQHPPSATPRQAPPEGQAPTPPGEGVVQGVLKPSQGSSSQQPESSGESPHQVERSLEGLIREVVGPPPESPPRADSFRKAIEPRRPPDGREGVSQPPRWEGLLQEAQKDRGKASLALSGEPKPPPPAQEGSQPPPMPPRPPQRLQESLRDPPLREPTPLEAAYARALGPDHPLYRRVARGLEGVEAQMAGARTHSDYVRLEGRLSVLDRYLEQALAQGADPRAAERLREELSRLREELSRLRQERALARGGGGDGPRPPSPTGSGGPGGDGDGGGGEGGGAGSWTLGPLAGTLRDYARRAAMGGLSRFGPLGALLARLGPLGALVGGGAALLGGVSLGARLLEGLNREARNEVEAATDLARLLESSRNPLALFREPGSLMPDRRLLELGYTARDAQRYALLYGLPGGVQGDVRALLAFSRTTGIGEEAAARAARELGLLGVDRGQVGAALEVLKAAMAEGVREGVDKASTLQGLLRLSQEAASRGVQATPTGLAFQAALQAALAGTGNRLLQGEMGAGVQGALKEAFAGAGDPGLQMLLVNLLGGLPGARELGLSGAEARGYERLRAQDPARAMGIALRLLPERNPALWARLVAQTEATLGPGLTAALLESVGVTGESLLTLLGTGLGSLAQEAARRAPGMRQDLLEDPQGRNRLYWEGVQMSALGRATEEANQLATLAVTRDLEKAMRRLKAAVEQAEVRLKEFLGGSLLGPGDLRGPVQEAIPLPGGRREAPRQERGQEQGPGAAFVERLERLEDRAARDREVNAYLRAVGVQMGMAPGRPYREEVRRRFPGLPERHQGLDLVYGDPRKPGDPVPSPFAGRVIRVGEDPKGYGKYVVLDVGGHEVLAGHFQEVRVRPGQQVRQGEVLGLEGATGAATGPHVHWEIRRGGKPVSDYEEFMNLFHRFLRQGMEGPREPRGQTAPSRQEVVVRVEGLDRIRVEGVPPPQADLIRQGLELMLQGAMPPPNWKGG